jgi:hypothetical protein
MEDKKPIPETNKKPLEKKDDKVVPKNDPVKKDEGYKAMPFKDYIEHTATIEGGDPEFKKMFPKEKEEQQNKREEDFRGKYGEYAANHSWMGDVYNKPIGGSKDRLGDVVLSTAKESGVDPKTLLGSFMEEGGYKLTYGAKDKYPASTLGLEDLDKDYDKIKKYLPEGFKNKFEVQKDDKRSVPVFKDPKDMTTALAGYLNYYKDEVGKAAKAKGIKLSPQAESFFTQAAYNSSKDLNIDNAKKMMDYYRSKGLLKDDKFLTEDNLGKDKYGAIYENTRRRIDSINALEKEGSIDLSEKRQKYAAQGTWTKDVHGTLKDSKQGRVFDLPSDKFNFNVLILKDGKKKVLPKGQSADNVDVTKLKDLDEYDIEANKN